MTSVPALIENLVESQAANVPEAGALLLNVLTEGRIDIETFLDDPAAVSGSPYFIPRYFTQITLRAIQDQYESIDELITSIQALVDREPPILEPKRPPSGDRVVLPEAKVLDLRQPVLMADGTWEATIEVLVTAGPFKNSEVEIHISSNRNRTACFIVPFLWTHATITAYNLVPVSESRFEACAETFLVLEPLRQVNVTTIARSLHCFKPQMDQIRRGKGDVTLPTLKGQLVHALFERILEGDNDLEAAYALALPQYLVALASVADNFFDEAAFRADVLRHTQALRNFVERNPQLRENAQLEVKRYSATMGIQGRIDALFRDGNHLDILELKTGKQIRPEDHAQVFIYRLLLSDLIRRWQRTGGVEIEITGRLLSSTDGSVSPMRLATDFHQVLDARNKLISVQHSLSVLPSSLSPAMPARYEGFEEEVCEACPSWTRRRCKDNSDLFGDRPESSDRPDLNYFRRLTRLVQRERWQADQDLANLLDDSMIETRVRNFRTIRVAKIVPDAEPFTFEFERNTSDLERGDSVLIHTGNISSTVSYHGHVREIDTNRMRISVPLKNLTSAVFADNEWIIDRFPSDVTAEASHTALYDFLAAPATDKKKVAILTDSQEEGPSPSGRGWPEGPGEGGVHLNKSQIQAIERSANCEVFHLIWGPPGTGKTKVIPEIVRRAGGRVLLGAFTNTAVDKMLLAVLEASPQTRFVRFGRASDSHELAGQLRGLGHDPADYFSEDLARKTGSVLQLKTALESSPILAATAHRACTAPFLRTRSFEMAIVDEAGQLTEPLTLGLILRSRRFVLIGDDRQLPPVVRSKSLAHSMFERLKKQAERSGSERLTLLDTQYRMHPEIMEVSNRLFYEGKLRSGVSAADRLPPDSNPVVFIPVESESQPSVDIRANLGEARVVDALVRDLIAVHRVRPESIGVVSPFRAQVVLMRHMLSGTGITVDTVERFQGGERDIMILSFVRPRGTGFVFDERRLNVAITRARRKLVLVAHPDLFRNTRYEWISTFIETLKTAGTI